MAVKKMRPTTPAQRGMTSQDFDQITTKKPVKSLLIAKKQKSVATTLVALPVVIEAAVAKRFIRIVEFNQRLV